MDVKTASVLPKALYPTTNSITKSELNQSQGKVEVTEVPVVKTASVLPRALYPTTNSITKSEHNQSQGKVEVYEVPDVKTPSVLPRALCPVTNSITIESMRQLFAEQQKFFTSELKSQVRVEAADATQTQLHFPPQSQLQTQYDEPQAHPTRLEKMLRREAQISAFANRH